MENKSSAMVIVLSGPMGAGKTTLIKKLSKKLGGAPALIFDHYENHAEWPQDLDKWLGEGANPNQVKVPQMRADLMSLLAGKPILHPSEEKRVFPSNYILIEEPFGREREEISELVDLVIYIDLPLDVCVVRLVHRALGDQDGDSKSNPENETRDQLLKRLESVETWLRQYMWIRSGLGITETIRRKADLVIDGMKPVNQMVQEAAEFISQVKKSA